MSYLVIARKWRPQTFEEVAGQPHVTRTLQNAVRTSRIAHAYLFTGARGVGKTSIARILAKALNCETGPTPTPCNTCSNCREITQGSAVDVLEIDGASNRGIDSIRELRETVRYRPAKSRFKIYIIDEVHMLTTEAFNALLKTLEEPPEHVLFIFATTEPHKIPSTILSRCQRFDFRRIPTQLLLKHLKKIAAEENSALSDGVLYAVAREAEGSMRDAQSLLEQLLAFSGDGLADEEILDVLGVVDRQSIHRAAEAILEGDVRTCMRVVADIYRRGIDSRRFCQQLAEHFRNLLFISLCGDDEDTGTLDLPEIEIESLKTQAAKTAQESLHLYFQTVLAGQEDIRRSATPRIALEMLLLRLAQLPRLESLDAVLKQIRDLERRIPVTPANQSTETGRGYDTHFGYKGEENQDRTADRTRYPRPDSGRPAASEPPRAPKATGIPAGSPAGRRVADVPSADSSGVPATTTNPAPGGFQGNAHGEAPMGTFVKTAGEGQPQSMAAQTPDGSIPDFQRPPLSAPRGSVRDEWPSFLLWLQNQDPMLAAKLTGSRIAETGGEQTVIEALDIYSDNLKDKQVGSTLSQAASVFFDRDISFEVRPLAAESASPRQQPKKSRQDMKRAIMNHPTVMMAVEILGGDLVDIRRVKGEKDVKEDPAYE